MAKYQVVWGCGHETTEQLVGKWAERERRINGAKYRDCAECFAAKKKEEAAEIQASSGLPELRGSEKQIQWAVSIRKDRVEKIEKYRGKIETRAKPEYKETMLKIFDEWAAKHLANTSASWWIDNQFESVDGLFPEECKEALAELKRRGEGQQ